MKKLIIFLFSLAFASSQLIGQKYFSKTGNITFYSSTPMEEIEATSNSASTVFDLGTGKIQWAVLIKSFEFEKALMQEHFNENYMESDKFPKASFKGEFVDKTILNFSEDGEIEVELTGVLTIHGEAQTINCLATFFVKGNEISASSNLKLLISDYNIKVPSVVSKNIAEEIEVTIKTRYEKLEQ